jgi:uncharacterized Zn finger protein
MKYFYCETCKDSTKHESIREEKHLYRCTECGTVSQHIPEKHITVRAILSSGEHSEVGSISLKKSDVVHVRDELIVETEKGFKIGEITSIELKNGRRSEIAEIGDVSTLWLRNIAEVPVRISLHKGGITKPVVFTAPGETEFGVNEMLEMDNGKYKITKIKLIDGKLLDRAGERAKTKNIKRIYAIFEKKKRKRR